MSYMGVSNGLIVLSDIGIYKGDFLEIDVDIVNESDRPIDVSSMTVVFKICDIQDEELVYLEKEGEMSIVGDNSAKITLLSQDTEDLSISKYRYIIEIHYETGNKNIGKGFLMVL